MGINRTKILQKINTIILMNHRLKPHHDRFSYKDYKGQFKIIVDGMPSKEICHLNINYSSNTIVIGEESFDLQKISAFHLSKYKKKLVDSALKHI